MAILSRFVLSLALTSQIWAQDRPKIISGADAQLLEEGLKNNPNDKAARASLLNYYYSSIDLDAVAIIEARRRHILWLIANAPEEAMASSPAATIDASGHGLADAEGYKQAAAAWRAVTARKDASVAMLINAAFFFKLPERDYTVELLDRALKMEPDNRNVAGFLGVEYAMAILGVTMVNKSGYPMASDPKLTTSALAKKARAELEAATSVYELNRAGYILSFQGSILNASGRLPFDYTAVAEKVLKRALILDPGNAYAKELLENNQQLKALTTGK